MKINIIARTNGVGLDRDVDLINKTLSSTEGFDVTVSHYRSISLLRRLFPPPQKYDVNIFLERIYPRWFGSARANILIPNKEHFPHRLIGNLKYIDHIFCKSRHAKEIFEKHHQSVRFTGFTSTDLLDKDVAPDYQKFLHLAGRSTQKGTATILELWKNNPSWPQLTIVQCKENAPAEVPDNVRLITEYIPHEEIKQLLNSHGVHLCTSSSEGWGHYIVEAMSCKAVVVTTDGPPMNEIISPERGILVPWYRQEPRHLGTDWHINPDKLEQNINKLLIMPGETKQRYGQKAREWFDANDLKFSKYLPETISQLFSKPSL